MPELGGRDLVTELRKRKDFDELPIIIISGIVGVNKISKLIDVGAIHFLGKPVKREEFQTCSMQLVEYGDKILSFV